VFHFKLEGRSVERISSMTTKQPRLGDTGCVESCQSSVQWSGPDTDRLLADCHPPKPTMILRSFVKAGLKAKTYNA